MKPRGDHLLRFPVAGPSPKGSGAEEISVKTSDPSVQRTVAVQEDAALEHRHWVRVSYVCNNRCCFCLDSDLVFLDPFVLPEEVEKRIDKGRAAGATRLIISGGEASIHPDFLEFVRYGKQAGYARVQTITNGRMFSYPRFLRQAVDAGLGEITFSLHSHRARIHDTLTGVPGAYDQALKALKLALAERGLIVSVDVVINRLNVATLDDTVAFFADLGVGEFDLLHLVPFGRAFSQETEEVPLAVGLRSLRDALERTIRLSEDRGLVIWTNRLPAAALEGHEHLIQDPHKLLDEVRGRQEHMIRLVETGTPLPCRDERCDVCYLAHFCDLLHPLQEQVALGNLPALRVTLDDQAPVLNRSSFPASLVALWVRAPSARQAGALPALGVPEIWELATLEGLAAPDGSLSPEAKQHHLRRLIVRQVDDLERALSLGVPEVKLLVDRHNWPWVAARLDALPPPLILGLYVPPRLSACVQDALDLSDPRLWEAGVRGVAIEDFPPCITGHRALGPAPEYVDLHVVDEKGRLDPDRYVAVYLREGYRIYSLRCQECPQRRTCPGLHVNLIRAQGFAVMRPERLELG